MNIEGTLSKQFNNQLSIRQVLPHTRQIIVPLFHEDGDMVDIFLEDISGSDYIRVCDHAMTLMRLSYDYDIDTPARKRILDRMLSENEIINDNGNLYIDTHIKDLYPAILHFAQVVAKVSSMRLHTKKLVRSMFLDDLRASVTEELSAYSPETDISPVPGRGDLVVDYVLHPGRRPLYLFGVNSSDKAKIVSITCQAFNPMNHKFVSWVANENFETLTNRDRAFLTNAVGKQFTSLDEWRTTRDPFLKAEAV